MQRKKILVVDDSNTVILMVKTVLTNARYDVIVARDGEEALQKVAEVTPDLILLDVVMPKLGGFEACKRLRARKELEQTPIIMLTTRGEADNREQGYAAGCSDYMTKPFNGLELAERVRSFLTPLEQAS
jgi:DNA-binding response OmpR family regulator